MLVCIENIEVYIGTEKTFAEYDSNSMVQDAAERNLITIGEAINTLLKRIPELGITNARKVVDARNKLTHGYDEIDNLQIWSTVTKHLPLLKKEVRTMLR